MVIIRFFVRTFAERCRKTSIKFKAIFYTIMIPLDDKFRTLLNKTG